MLLVCNASAVARRQLCALLFPGALSDDDDAVPEALRYLRGVLRQHNNEALKTVLNELVLVLSDGDPPLFTSRVGKGNAVLYMIGKGMVEIPSM
jgi:hypothetical protein